jgi:glycosyltransferase involved in cell wall biosynthesis
MPQGVSTVVDMLSQCLPSSEHKFFRVTNATVNKDNPKEAKANSKQRLLGRLKPIKNIGFIYVLFMIISAFRVVLSGRKHIKPNVICLAHDIFCLFWLGFFRYFRIIPNCEISLYNHSDGHPLDTIKQKFPSKLLAIPLGIVGFAVNRLKICTVYSLSETASNRIKLLINKTADTRFVVILNYVSSVAINKSDWCNDKPSIWLIGTVCERKGQISLFEDIAKTLSVNNYGLMFNVLGPCNDSDLQKLESFSFVRYMGVSSNVRELLSPKDICLSVSSNEGLPMSLIEATSKACIVISTDVGGCNKVCINEANGYLISYPFNAIELSDLIIKLTDDPKKLNEFAEQSLVIFQERFSEERAKKYWKNESEKLY